MTKRKKNARERRALVGALCTAAVIVAGSTFAWFTSEDEVTNRLSASANYDVSIAEDFQPPENWLPGQKINKDVSAVNTGNVDAFVRMWLGGQMRLLNEETTAANMKEAVKPASASLTGDLTAVTDKDMLALGLTWQKTTDGKPVYYRTLSTKKIDNDKDASHATATDEETNSPATFSEVQSMMAGGVLVYAPTDAKFSWKLEQATEMKTYTGDADATGTVTNIAKDTVVGTYGATGISAAISSNSNKAYYGAIDASTFQPETEGLYLFRRNVKETADGTANTYEYSGYYYVPASGGVSEQYFALHTGTGANGESDYVLPSGVINDNSTAEPSKDQVLPVTIASGQKVYLYTATEKVIDTGTGDTNLIWKYHAPDSTKETDLEKNGYFTVTYKGADGKTGTETVEGVTTDYTADDIVINVALANISDAAEAWTAIYAANADNHLTTFYYNNDVESGDTTTKLVDSVELSKNTKNGAYLAFDFDLNVFLESIQVTMDEAGIEQITPATEAWSVVSSPAVNTEITTATATMGATNPAEIATITWSKATS